MSNSQTTPEATSSTTTAAPPKGSSKRLGILLFVLAGSVAAMGYDRYVAKPAVQAAYNAILKENGKVYTTIGKTFTNKDLQNLIGKTPAKTLTDSDGNTVEIYQWRAGLPIRTHDLFAIYEQKDDSLIFREVGTGNYEDIVEASASMSGETTLIVPTQEELADYARADRESNSGGGDDNSFSDADQESLEQAEEDQENNKQRNADTEDEDSDGASAPDADSPATDSEPSKPQPSVNASAP
ncbi:MAG: hypothetical protein CMM07_12970 [Rhodopirellula sp.]|nr:hypothetical protein [Rhodopirellula sp.]